MIRIDNWCVVDAPDSEFTAPELRERCLHGIVTGHPHVDDGESVTTSAITGLSGNSFIKTRSGSIYELGDVLPDYEKLYPEAELTLINNLKRSETKST